MDARMLLLEALDARWKKYRAGLKNCRADFSGEAVHDLRVAARRLLAWFDLSRSVASHKRIQKIRRELKNQLDDFDDLRDTQVLLADASEFIHEIPGIKPVRETWSAEEARLMRLARKRIKSYDDTGMAKRVAKTGNAFASLPVEGLAGRVLAAVDETYARALRVHAPLDPENIPGIHRFRIAFKKFRYSVEIAHPLLPNLPPPLLERMNDFQGQMGDIQDLDVARQKIADLNPASFPGLETISAHYAFRLQTAAVAFIEDKGEALVFWRAAPDQTFPWENPP